ncbi:MAG: YlbD family protein [Anaeroplasmataceae bacterium]|nr:YlbD family protein [Anaeroplasmataceae bacterium]
MSAKLDEFKEFVKKHPLIKGMVDSKQKTWQELFEDYCMLGEEAFPEEQVKEETAVEVKKETKSLGATEDLIKTVVGYVKKIDPDQVTKTVTSIQKVLELFGGIGGAATGSALAKKSTGDPLFDKRFDEWY